ncbi:tetratricopeptide repeat protein [Paractinoplanes toevensis]|uniref:TIR domain-containing protein n=1 Tax=Paractinoplanes toevensis TaxID=571911 RepID=A0A919T6K9_9ACTN|nr:toll/interleukin-1 receptor domain-containing protein [Actinoplanes toevensis]GIM90309.1 hypothetical protein Ato02nite_021020 [Actinoplanes toevensis]
MIGTRFDVFMSLAGPDRTRVRDLVAAMRKAGLTVFYDEDMPEYHAITAEVEAALHHSTALVAYYSRDYTGRTACQYELTRAFLAGQREGDPTRRIMVINPHEGTDHLAPAELADKKFDRLTTTDLAAVVRRIKAKVNGLSGRIGDLPGPDPQQWHAYRVPGTPDFTGRYHELWKLHSGLTMHRFGLTHHTSSGGTCILTGLPGIGKSAVAAAYAWHFSAGHQGGVWWVSLAGSGTDPDSMIGTFVDGLRALPAFRTIRPAAPATEVIGAFADHVAGLAEPSLLVIDDIPGELTAELIHRFAVPSVGRRLRTVLITNRAVPDGPVRPIEIVAMSDEDAAELLRHYRDGAKLQRTALARRLGHHPVALSLAGRLLRDRAGLLDYAGLTQRIDRDAATIAPVTALLRDRIGTLDDNALGLLRVAVVGSDAALPASLVRRLLGGTAAEQAVEDLQRELVVTASSGGWQVHALVRDTVREHYPAPDWTTPAVEAAEAILDTAGPDQSEEALLVRHAAHLAARDDLPDQLTERLHRRALERYDPLGEAILALPHHRALARRFPDDPAILLAAARCMVATGGFEEAREHAERAGGDEGRRIVADALDALGRLAEAEPLWTAMMADPTPSAETELAYLRSRRLRGRHQEARRGLEALIPRLPFDQAQAAQLELARAEMETDAQVAARRRAAAVVTAYADRGLSDHVTAVEAIRMLADARLTLALTDLKADEAGWQEAARELQGLRDRHAETHGPRNSLTLTLAVAHGESLTALGRPAEAREAIEAVYADVLDRLGPEHPTALRADLVLGYAAAQFHEFEAARNHFTRAFEGLRDVLGPTHPHTLRAEFNLAVALKMLGDPAAQPHFNQVARHTAGAVGIKTDLFWQSIIGAGLQVLPSWLWRKLANPPKPRKDG